jgi:hypothetical protein
MALKSAYELAMEKAGSGAAKPLTDEQKLAIQKLRADFAVKRKEENFLFQAAVSQARIEAERNDDQEKIAFLIKENELKIRELEAEEEAAVEKLKIPPG